MTFPPLPSLPSVFYLPPLCPGHLTLFRHHMTYFLLHVRYYGLQSPTLLDIKAHFLDMVAP